MNESEVKYCIRCATPLVRRVRFGRLRPECPACGWIYFQDPKVAVAVFVVKDRKVLLVRRVNEPFRGCWTFPAGFLDAGEDPARAAAREGREETGLEIQIVGLFDVIAHQEHPRGAHLLLVYRGEVLSGKLQPGDDADQVGFFSLNALPPLAFKSTTEIIQHFLSAELSDNK